MSSPPPRPPPPPLDAHAQPGAAGDLTETPPPPPPKPGSAAHQQNSWYGGPPGQTQSTGGGEYTHAGLGHPQHDQPPRLPAAPAIEEGWLPETLKEQSKPDLEILLADPTLLDAVLRAPITAHPSLPDSDALILSTINQNYGLANHVSSLATSVAAQRAEVSSRLVQLRALERQWHLKQSAMDDALAPFSPKALHARLVAGISEQEGVLVAMEESFLEEEGKASDREVVEFVKRWRDARKVLGLRRERRRRFEEGRVGGWR